MFFLGFVLFCFVLFWFGLVQGGGYYLSCFDSANSVITSNIIVCIVCIVDNTQTFASTEVNPWRWRRVVAKCGLLHAACRALPKPRLAVHDLDLFALQQLVTCSLCSGILLVPHLEVNEHLVVALAALVGLGNHVNAFHCTQIQLLNHIIDVLARRALEHARNADAGFVGFGFLILLFLYFLVLHLFLAENVGRVGKDF